MEKKSHDVIGNAFAYTALALVLVAVVKPNEGQDMAQDSTISEIDPNPTLGIQVQIMQSKARIKKTLKANNQTLQEVTCSDSEVQIPGSCDGANVLTQHGISVMPIDPDLCEIDRAAAIKDAFNKQLTCLIQIEKSIHP